MSSVFQCNKYNIKGQLRMMFRPFKGRPKRVDGEKNQFQYLRLNPYRRMNVRMCEVFQKLNQQNWSLNERQFTLEQYQSVFDLINECQTVSIWIHENKSSRIIELLLKPQFNDLRELVICQCQITNLQILQFVNAPLLSILIINDNQVSNLHALKKTQFDQLEFISLSFNRIKSHQELKVLARFVTKAKKKLINLQNYIYDPNESYEWMQYEGTRAHIFEQQDEEPQIIYKNSENQCMLSPIRTYQMTKKLSCTPFLAKAYRPNIQKQIPKITF